MLFLSLFCCLFCVICLAASMACSSLGWLQQQDVLWCPQPFCINFSRRCLTLGYSHKVILSLALTSLVFLLFSYVLMFVNLEGYSFTRSRTSSLSFSISFHIYTGLVELQESFFPDR